MVINVIIKMASGVLSLQRYTLLAVFIFIQSVISYEENKLIPLVFQVKKYHT